MNARAAGGVAAVVSVALALAACGDSVEVQKADDPNAPPAPTSAGVPSDAVVLKEMQDRINGEISIELSDSATARSCGPGATAPGTTSVATS